MYFFYHFLTLIWREYFKCLAEDMGHTSSTVNNMVAEGLVMQESRPSVGRVLPELTQFYETVSMNMYWMVLKLISGFFIVTITFSHLLLITPMLMVKAPWAVVLCSLRIIISSQDNWPRTAKISRQHSFINDTQHSFINDTLTLLVIDWPVSEIPNHWY